MNNQNIKDHHEDTKKSKDKNFVFSAIAPALPYLLHPCSRSCLRGELIESVRIEMRTYVH